FDPTSPYSGGAILGDRIRMIHHANDSGVFIRSFGTRDNLSGIPVTLPYMLKLYALAGMRVGLVETLRSRQLDVLIKHYTDTTILLLTPESGDEIQIMKAGILEVADIFIINKSDRPGVDRMMAQLTSWIGLLPSSMAWKPTVLAVQANEAKGMQE